MCILGTCIYFQHILLILYCLCYNVMFSCIHLIPIELNYSWLEWMNKWMNDFSSFGFPRPPRFNHHNIRHLQNNVHHRVLLIFIYTQCNLHQIIAKCKRRRTMWRCHHHQKMGSVKDYCGWLRLTVTAFRPRELLNASERGRMGDEITRDWLLVWVDE